MTESKPQAGAATLRAVLDAHVAAQNAQDAAAVMRQIHPDSPMFESTRQMLSQLYINYRFANELLEWGLVGVDRDYIYARMRLKTVKLEGPEFQNNQTDAVLILKPQADELKIWAQFALSQEPLA